VDSLERDYSVSLGCQVGFTPSRKNPTIWLSAGDEDPGRIVGKDGRRLAQAMALFRFCR
jgi:predicted RNA-binding protein YlqC (UPF0109 family)